MSEFAKLRSLAERRLPDPDLPPMSPEMEALRARFLGAVEHLTITEALAMLKSRLATETKEMMRLGNLAAQTWLVRQRLVAIRKGLEIGSVAEILKGTPRKAPRAAAADGAAAPEGEAPQPQPIDPLSWVRVRIVSEAEVNGMRFFGGTALDVKGADAERLIAAGTAELLVETAPATTAAPTPEPAAPAPAAPAGRGRAKAKS